MQTNTIHQIIHSLETLLGKNVSPAGLLIEKEIPYLGTSSVGRIPFGDIFQIIEVKCPIKIDHNWNKDGTLNKKHNWSNTNSASYL